MSLSQAACEKTVCMIDHKLLHDASFTMVNVLDGPCSTAKCRHCVTHMTIMNFAEMWVSFKSNPWWWRCHRI